MHLFEQANSVVAFLPTGSRVICDPPVMDTDEDFVLLVGNLEDARRELEALGYVVSPMDTAKYGAKHDPFSRYNYFTAWRHPGNDHNLIVTERMYTYHQWRTATSLAKMLNLTDKRQRVTLFRAIRSGGEVYTAPELIPDHLL